MSSKPQVFIPNARRNTTLNWLWQQACLSRRGMKSHFLAGSASQKGLIQTLFECGLIVPLKCNPWKKRDHFYTINGRKNFFGYVIPGSSPRQLMEMQLDFVDKETLQQFLGRHMGIFIDPRACQQRSWV